MSLFTNKQKQRVVNNSSQWRWQASPRAHWPPVWLLKIALKADRYNAPQGGFMSLFTNKQRVVNNSLQWQWQAGPQAHWPPGCRWGRWQPPPSSSPGPALRQRRWLLGRQPHLWSGGWSGQSLWQWAYLDQGRGIFKQESNIFRQLRCNGTCINTEQHYHYTCHHLAETT